MAVDSSVLHRDPGATPEELRSRGRIDFEPIAARVAIGDERRSHIGIIGKTGQGKSTLLKNIALRDIRDGKAVVYFDPHVITVACPLQRRSDAIAEYIAPQIVKPNTSKIPRWCSKLI
jgi:ABC-type iron transport system FetAB ATPase subunit